MSTPFGHPSDLITIGELEGIKVAFLPRHGRNHTIPHGINYRANIWALKEIGVTRIISPSAVGSLDTSFVPGDIIVPDQFIDFTKRSNLLLRRKGLPYFSGPIHSVQSSEI
jgi:5'-methylthioadenosine phosphorylase